MTKPYMINKPRVHVPNLLRYVIVSFMLIFSSYAAYAEQFKQVGEYQVHYIVIPTTFLNAQVAQKYKLKRGEHLALVNISVLNAELDPVAAAISGHSINLLSQKQSLKFEEVKEGKAIYYLAQLRHANEEHHRVFIDIITPAGDIGQIEFLQQMYFEP